MDTGIGSPEAPEKFTFRHITVMVLDARALIKFLAFYLLHVLGPGNQKQSVITRIANSNIK